VYLSDRDLNRDDGIASEDDGVESGGCSGRGNQTYRFIGCASVRQYVLQVLILMEELHVHRARCDLECRRPLLSTST
jgi:hypothetical protein